MNCTSYFRKKLHFLVLIGLFFQASFVNAQEGIWSIFDDPVNPSAFDMRVWDVLQHPENTSPGTSVPTLLIVGGLADITGGGAPGFTVKLIEFDPVNGTIVAEKRYATTAVVEVGYRIIPRFDSGGNLELFYIVGNNKTTSNANSQNILVISIDPSYNIIPDGVGNAITNVFGTDVPITIVNEYGRNAALDMNGNLVVMTGPDWENINCNDGTPGPLGYGGADVALMEIVPGVGAVQYVQMGDAVENNPQGMVHDTRSGQDEFIVVGRHNIANFDGFFIKAGYDAAGDFEVINSHYYPLPAPVSREEVIDVNIANIGAIQGYAMVGFTNRDVTGLNPNFSANCIQASGDNHILFYLVDNDGNDLNRLRVFGGQGDYTAIKTIQTADDGYAILGLVQPCGSTLRDLLLIRLNSDLSVRWAKTYGDPAGDEFASQINSQLIERIGSGGQGEGFIFVGETFGYTGGLNASQKDAFVVYTDFDGNAILHGDPTCENDVTIEVATFTFDPSVAFAADDARCFTSFNETFDTLVHSTLTAQQCPLPPADCDAANDPLLFTPVAPGTVIATGTTEWWDGKYYFPSGSVLTVQNGATLDLTNVDLVFDECAGILFEDGAILRANNSVFRPCEQDESWLGFEFQGNSTAEINECTYKNANYAIWLNGGAGFQADVNVTNTLFSNNYIGINANNVGVTQSISGNTFLIDNQMLDIDWAAPGCNFEVPVDDYFGIRAVNSEFDYDISQNDFINGGVTGQGGLANLNYFGVNLLSCFANVSANNFTDMFRAVDISGAGSRAFIENNEMEVTVDFDGQMNQIQINNTSNVLISGNSITSSVDHTGAVGAARSAIFMQASADVNVLSNNVEGFNVGINAVNLDNTYIGENDLRNNGVLGIFIRNGSNVDVSCNSIDMDMDFGSVNAGYVYIQTLAGNAGMTLRNNCITEGDFGAIFFGGPGDVLPVITNNNFTNYRIAGVSKVGMTGGLGSGPGLSAAQSGRNSFFSNNIPQGAVDVANDLGSPTMLVRGNFGISSITANVTVLGNNLYSSNASCGTQTGIVANHILAADECDAMVTIITNLIVGGSNAMQVSDELDAQLKHMNPDQRLRTLRAVMTKLHQDGEHDFLETFTSEVVASGETSIHEDQWLNYYHALLKEEWSAAAQVLSLISPQHQLEEDLLFTEELHLRWKSNVGVITFTNEEHDQLEEIFLRRNEASALAADLINYTGPVYRFHYDPLPVLPGLGNETTFIIDQFKLDVWPNPVNDEVNISTTLDTNNGATLQLFDSQGRVVHQQAINANFSVITLNMAAFDAGMYICILESPSGEKAYSRISKN